MDSADNMIETASFRVFDQTLNCILAFRRFVFPQRVLLGDPPTCEYVMYGKAAFMGATSGNTRPPTSDARASCRSCSSNRLPLENSIRDLVEAVETRLKRRPHL